MTKYKNLYRASELTADYEKLIAWQALSRSAKQALYKTHLKDTPRMNLERAQGYIRIFGSPLGLVVIQKKIPSTLNQPASEPDAETLVTTLINIATPARASIILPIEAGVNILPAVKKFKFAKLKIIKVLKAVPDTVGRVIGVHYTKINTEAISTPFGRGTVTETYLQAVAAMKASEPYIAFLAVAPPAGTFSTNKIIIYPEAEAS